MVVTAELAELLLLLREERIVLSDDYVALLTAGDHVDVVAFLEVAELRVLVIADDLGAVLDRDRSIVLVDVVAGGLLDLKSVAIDRLEDTRVHGDRVEAAAVGL